MIHVTSSQENERSFGDDDSSSGDYDSSSSDDNLSSGDILIWCPFFFYFGMGSFDLVIGFI